MELIVDVAPDHSLREGGRRVTAVPLVDDPCATDPTINPDSLPKRVDSATVSRLVRKRIVYPT